MSREYLYSFVVDTEQYVDSFRRELCAYVTAQVGESEFESSIAASRIARAELPAYALSWFDIYVRYEDDAGGRCEPALPAPTPGWVDVGMACYFRDGTDPGVMRAGYLDAVDRYTARRVQQCESVRGLDGEVRRAMVEAVYADRVRYENMELVRHAAHLSVAILLGEEPPSEIAVLMRERALKFAAAWSWSPREGSDDPSVITVTGFRLVGTEVVRVDTELARWSR